jgi:hypothetical protein
MAEAGIVRRFKESIWNPGKVKKNMASKKKPRKQKSKTLKRQFSGLPAHGIMVSEAIMRLSESLISRWRASHITPGMITLVAMAWNISFFPKEEQVDVQGLFLDMLPEQLSAKNIASLSEDIDILIERKNRDYPHIREYILDYQPSFSGDTVTLMVETAPVPE